MDIAFPPVGFLQSVENFSRGFTGSGRRDRLFAGSAPREGLTFSLTLHGGSGSLSTP